MNELQGDGRPTDAINHPFNVSFMGPRPDIFEQGSLTQGCSDAISCDVWYERDWNSAKIQASINCDDLVTQDPCFGSYACSCTNNYLRVTYDMPEGNGWVPPGSGSGSSGGNQSGITHDTPWTVDALHNPQYQESKSY